VVELTELNELFNATFITSPEGELLCYRKRLLFEADVQWALSGDLYPAPHSERQSNFLLDRTHIELSEPDAPYLLLNIFGWRATLGICMDLNDARFLQFCEEAKVDLVIFPTNWIEEGHDVAQYWAHLLRDTRATLLAANSHGSEGEITFSGGSAILQATPPTLIGQAPLCGDYVITATLSHSSSREES
jgi:predicted amidohydrolase